MNLNELKYCIRQADLANAEPQTVQVKDLVLLLNEIKNLEEQLVKRDKMCNKLSAELMHATLKSIPVKNHLGAYLNNSRTL